MLKGKPIVTVVMMTRNRCAFLEKSVGSVLDQSIDNLELFLVDDASTDDTPNVLKGFAKRDKRVNLIRNEKPILVKSRNLALERAKGEYFAAIDDDDTWMPDKLEKQLTVAETASVVGCYRLSAGLENIQKHRTLVSRPIDLYQMFEDGGDFLSPSQLITKTEYARAVGGYDEQIGGARGFDFAIKIVKSFGAGIVVPKFLVLFEGAGKAKKEVRTGQGKKHYGGMLEVYNRYYHDMTYKQRKIRRAQIEFRPIYKGDLKGYEVFLGLTKLCCHDAPKFWFSRRMVGIATRRFFQYLSRKKR